MSTQPGIEVVPFQVNGISTALIDGKLTDDQRNYFEELWKECPTADIDLFFWTAERYQLNPFGVAQLYGVPRKQGGVKRLVTQVGINGLTLIAQRTGEFGGIGLPEWCGEDERWRSIWNLHSANGKPLPPTAAKISVTRMTRYGASLSWGIAMWQESADLYDGKPQNLWASKPAHMLAKTATATAIRRAFQQEFAELRAEFSPELGEARHARVSDLYAADTTGGRIAGARVSALPERSSAGEIPDLAGGAEDGQFREEDRQPASSTSGSHSAASMEAPKSEPAATRQGADPDGSQAFWARVRKYEIDPRASVAAHVFNATSMLAWLKGEPSRTWATALAELDAWHARRQADADEGRGDAGELEGFDDEGNAVQASMSISEAPAVRAASARGAH